MGWSNGPKSWAELERRLSDGRRHHLPAPDSGVPANGGDSPAWSRKRSPYEPIPLRQSGEASEHHQLGPSGGPSDHSQPYAELHCHTNFSFLDGASHAEELAEEAVRLGLSALAVTDHDGLYGVVRFAEAARAYGLPTIFGSELTLEATSRSDQRVGRADPEGDHLVVLAEDPIGYGRLARAISTSHLAAGEKGAPRLRFDELAALATGDTEPFRRALASMPAPEKAIAHLHQNSLGDAAEIGRAHV